MSNIPAFAIFSRASERVGVAFNTTNNNLTILIGPRGDPNQKKYFAKSCSHQLHEVYGYTDDGRVDFTHLVGIAMRNADRSMTLRLHTPDDSTSDLRLPGTGYTVAVDDLGRPALQRVGTEYQMRPVSPWSPGGARKSHEADRSYLLAHD